MSNTHSTPAIIGRTLRILANELLLLAESIKDPLTPAMRAGIQLDLAEICNSITRCADALEAGHA